MSTSQPASVASESTSTIGTKTAETRSTSRWIGALPDWASSTSRAICASAVSAPTFVARTTSRPYVLIVRAGDLGARADVDGHRLARQHRLVDRGRALLDDAVGRDLLSRPDDEEIAGDELVDRHEDLDAVAQHTRLLRAELEQRADRLARAPARASLEVAAEQDQRRDHGARPRSTCPRRAGDEDDDRPAQAASVPIEMSVSIVAAPWRAFRSAARWNGQPAQETTGVASASASPLPALELERRHHREQRRAAR